MKLLLLFFVFVLFWDIGYSQQYLTTYGGICGNSSMVNKNRVKFLNETICGKLIGRCQGGPTSTGIYDNCFFQEYQTTNQWDFFCEPYDKRNNINLKVCAMSIPTTELTIEQALPQPEPSCENEDTYETENLTTSFCSWCTYCSSPKEIFAYGKKMIIEDIMKSTLNFTCGLTSQVDYVTIVGTEEIYQDVYIKRQSSNLKQILLATPVFKVASHLILNGSDFLINMDALPSINETINLTPGSNGKDGMYGSTVMFFALEFQVHPKLENSTSINLISSNGENGKNGLNGAKGRDGIHSPQECKEMQWKTVKEALSGDTASRSKTRIRIIKWTESDNLLRADFGNGGEAGVSGSGGCGGRAGAGGQLFVQIEKSNYSYNTENNDGVSGKGGDAGPPGLSGNGSCIFLFSFDPKAKSKTPWTWAYPRDEFKNYPNTVQPFLPRRPGKIGHKGISLQPANSHVPNIDTLIKARFELSYDAGTTSNLQDTLAKLLKITESFQSLNNLYSWPQIFFMLRTAEKFNYHQPFYDFIEKLAKERIPGNSTNELYRFVYETIIEAKGRHNSIQTIEIIDPQVALHNLAKSITEYEQDIRIAESLQHLLKTINNYDNKTADAIKTLIQVTLPVYFQGCLKVLDKIK